MACISRCSPSSMTCHLSCVETRAVWALLLCVQYRCWGWGLPGWHLLCVPTGHHVSIVHCCMTSSTKLGHLKTGIYLTHDSVGLQFCLNLPGSFCSSRQEDFKVAQWSGMASNMFVSCLVVGWGAGLCLPLFKRLVWACYPWTLGGQSSDA